MEFRIVINAHRKDYLEYLETKTYEYTILASDELEAEDWAEEKAHDIEYEDKNVTFCVYNIFKKEE